MRTFYQVLSDLETEVARPVVAPRQQFNVSLPPDLVRRTEHRAVDDQLSLSDLVERVLEAHLATAPPLVLAPMVHVEDMGTDELNLTSREDLERLEERVVAAVVVVARPTTDEGFGRQLQPRGPDGLLVKVDELEPDLYG